MINGSDLQTAALFRALSNPVRLGMLRYLAANPDCLCGEVVRFAGLAQSTVSTHLAVLRQAGLVCGTEDGPATCLCVDVEGLRGLGQQVADLVEQLVQTACCDANDGCADGAECCSGDTACRATDHADIALTSAEVAAGSIRVPLS